MEATNVVFGNYFSNLITTVITLVIVNLLNSYSFKA